LCQGNCASSFLVVHSWLPTLLCELFE
jgi:hypothetical protein